ncbi:MAG: hypothetical protein HYR55_08090 [Acidobacteria bacterium]|nr:hypothetical protein [Acidobacteriota bacterium]MBI3656406.1 hypothetical protein [Acidobacteriota bacterium]
MRVQDIALFINNAVFRDGLVNRPCSEWPPKSKFNIAHDLWVGKLNNELVEMMFEACEPPGYWEVKPIRQFSQLYAFVRELDLDYNSPNWYSWDTDERLQTSIALSRLIKPISSHHYSARVIYDSDSQTVKTISPYQSNDTYGIGIAPNWLTTGDLAQLAGLVTLFFSSNFHEIGRLWRAFCYYELAVRSLLIDVKWVFIVTAIEALVQLGRGGSALRDFKTRVPHLAKISGIQFSASDAAQAFKLKSGIGHGEGFPRLKRGAYDQENKDIPESDQQFMILPTKNNYKLELYRRTEDVLRNALMKAIREEGFREVFTTPRGIKNYFES